MKATKGHDREDWTSMTLADWMDVSPSEWMDRALSPWGQAYGDILRRTPAEWLAGYGDLMRRGPADWWTTMYGGGALPATWPPRRAGERGRHHGPCSCSCGCDDDHEHRKKPHHRDHGCCRRCGSDPCECYCCIGDVDLAVYARVGEQRVIPIVVENERRREKQITLELSGWTTRGGRPAPVDTVQLEPKTFTLPPCGEQKVTLVVKIRAAETDTATQSQSGAPEGRGLPDVDNCLVVYADLRLVGCDHRSIRIAVAILPRDCDPYVVGCGCSCC